MVAREWIWTDVADALTFPPLDGLSHFGKDVPDFCSLKLSLSSCGLKQITLSPDARNTAWVSFDGRKRQEIQHGDWWSPLSVTVSLDRFLLPQFRNKLFPFLSQQHQDHHILLPGAIYLLPWPGVRLVRKSGSVFALERAQEAGPPGGRLRLIRHRKLNHQVPLLARLSSWVSENEETRFVLRSPHSHCTNIFMQYKLHCQRDRVCVYTLISQVLWMACTVLLIQYFIHRGLVTFQYVLSAVLSVADREKACFSPRNEKSSLKLLHNLEIWKVKIT